MQVLVNFYRGAIESILTGNLTNWHGLCMIKRALHWVIKTAQNIIGSLLPSISDIGEVPAQSPKDTKRQYPP